MEGQIGSKLFVLRRIIEDYIDNDVDCTSLQNLQNNLQTENDIEEAIAEFLSEECGAWSEWSDILDFSIKLNSSKIPFKELCLYYIYEEEYENAVLCYYKSKLELNDFLKDTTFYVDYEENKLYTFLEELSSAFIKGDYYDIPKDPLKGFDLLYNFVNENYAILPEHVSSQLLDVLYEFSTENECLKPQINKLTNLKDFDQEEDVEENKIDISKQPKKEKKQRKPRKKNKLKSFFKKITSFLK